MTLSLYILGAMTLLFIISTLIPNNTFTASPLFYGLSSLLFINLTLCCSRHSLLLIKRLVHKGKAAINKSFIRSVAIQLIHLGIILVFIAALTKLFFAQNIDITLPEGSTYTLPDHQHHIKLNRFRIVLDKNKDLKNYESDLSIFNVQGREESRKKLSVNHLVKAGDYLLYQSFYGKSFTLTLTTPQNTRRELIAQESQTISLSATAQLLVYQYFPDFSGGTGFDSTSLSSEDNNPVLWLILKGEQPQSIMLPLGKTVVIENMTLQFSRSQNYSGIKVVKDPSLIWMWAAVVLLSVGFLSILYLSKEAS